MTLSYVNDPSELSHWIPAELDPPRRPLVPGVTRAAAPVAVHPLEVGGANLVADGSFGPITQRAVTAFQTSSGIHVDGRVDAASWTALEG